MRNDCTCCTPLIVTNHFVTYLPLFVLSCLHRQSYSLNSLFAGSNANKEKRIGVPFAPFQAPLPSASKSALHSSTTTATEALPTDGTNNVTIADAIDTH